MIAVDANVAAKWGLPEEHSDRARALVMAAVRSDERLVAPPLLRFELTNIVRKHTGRGGLSPEQARGVLARCLAVPVQTVLLPDFHQRALETATGYMLGGYDAYYVTLAQYLGCDLWTDDRKLLRALGGRLSFVRWIGDFEES